MALMTDFDTKYFYDYQAKDFAKINELTDKIIEFKYSQYDGPLRMSLKTFCDVNAIYEKAIGSPSVKFLTEKEYLFEQLKHG